MGSSKSQGASVALQHKLRFCREYYKLLNYYEVNVYNINMLSSFMLSKNTCKYFYLLFCKIRNFYLKSKAIRT